MDESRKRKRARQTIITYTMILLEKQANLTYGIEFRRAMDFVEEAEHSNWTWTENQLVMFYFFIWVVATSVCRLYHHALYTLHACDTPQKARNRTVFPISCARFKWILHLSFQNSTFNNHFEEIFGDEELFFLER